jgi:hypothetical protein
MHKYFQQKFKIVTKNLKEWINRPNKVSTYLSSLIRSNLLLIEFDEYLKSKPEFTDEESLHRYYLSYDGAE